MNSGISWRKRRSYALIRLQLSTFSTTPLKLLCQPCGEWVLNFLVQERLLKDRTAIFDPAPIEQLLREAVDPTQEAAQQAQAKVAEIESLLVRYRERFGELPE